MTSKAIFKTANGQITLQAPENTIGDYVLELPEKSSNILAEPKVTHLIYVNTINPPVNGFVEFVAKTPGALTTLDEDCFVNSKTIKLKAGKMYHVHGGITEVTSTGGILSTNYAVYSDIAGVNEITGGKTSSTQAYLNLTTHYRIMFANFYYKPVQDCYLKMLVATNTLTGFTSIVPRTTITEL